MMGVGGVSVVTSSIATLLVTVPKSLLTMTRKRAWSSANVTSGNTSVLLVAPAMST